MGPFRLLRRLLPFSGWAVAALLFAAGLQEGRHWPWKSRLSVVATRVDEAFHYKSISGWILPWSQQSYKQSPDPLNLLTLHEQRITTTFQEVSPKVACIRAVFVPDPVTQVGMSSPSFVARISAGHAKRGSGFLWDQHGHIVTNAHVVHGQSLRRLSVVLGNTVIPAEVVRSCSDVDIAVLRLQNTTSVDSLPSPIRIGTSSDLRIGQTALAMGCPLGSDTHLTVGVVSGFEEDDGIHFDAPVQPGYSGGPLTDSQGRLIGVAGSLLRSSSSSERGIGIAIPVNVVARVVNQIARTTPGRPLEKETTIRPCL